MKFTADFKIEAVRLAESGRPASAVARKLQSVEAVAARGRRHREHCMSSNAIVRDAFPGNGKLTSQDEEIQQLRRRVAQLEVGREIPKKAMAFFATEFR